MATKPAAAGADVSSSAGTASSAMSAATPSSFSSGPGTVKSMGLNKMPYPPSPPLVDAVQHVALDEQLLQTLMDYRASLYRHAQSIVKLVKAEHYFDIGLEIVKTMVALEDNRADEGSMRHTLHISHVVSQEIFREKLVAFLLHGESFLRCVHENLPPERNPFLWHWMAIVKDYKSSGEALGAVTTVSGVWHLRYEYVKTLLRGTMLERESPASFEWMIADGAAAHAPPMDFSKFEKALNDLGISDDENDLEEGDLPTEYPPQADNFSRVDSSLAQEKASPGKILIQATKPPSEGFLESAFLYASTSETGEQEGARLAETITKQPDLVTSSLVRAVSSLIPSLVRTSLQFSKIAVPALLSSITAASTSDLDVIEARNELIWALGRLPADLPSMDLISTLLISRNSKGDSLIPDSEVLIHAYLATALRALEDIGTSGRGRDQTAAMAASSFSNNVPLSAGEALLASLGGQTGREAQARVVELLLLFINNLLRREIVTMRSLRFEIQELGVRYIFVPAAKEFWQEAQKILYDPKAKDFDE